MVGIIMGSQSDWELMKPAADFLTEMNIAFKAEVVSAHRTPLRMVEYAQKSLENGLKVIIAGAGGAAHLPGMIASLTILPIIGVPIKSHNSIDGWDSMLSILQMPNGVPVATVALNASQNAGILAAQILAIYQPDLREKLLLFKQKLKEKVEKNAILM
ncbi:MAG: 5-(carboxyamino)imidazole ribonucleotide mutase [Cytophagales bacterium]|nr:MAG: 5-(carboxyamino)imidazole ribonucleotide mutase [Cytophagales bacterium]